MQQLLDEVIIHAILYESTAIHPVSTIWKLEDKAAILCAWRYGGVSENIYLACELGATALNANASEDNAHYIKVNIMRFCIHAIIWHRI